MNRESVHRFLLNAHLIQVTLWTWQAHWSPSGPARHTCLTWHSSQISHYLPLWISCSHKPNQVAPLDLLGIMSFLLQPISSSRCFTYLLNEMNREYDRSFLLNAHLKQVTLWTTGPTWHSRRKALWPNFSLVTPLGRLLVTPLDLPGTMFFLWQQHYGPRCIASYSLNEMN